MGNDIIYFTNTPEYHQFVVLKKIFELREIELPVDTDDEEFLNSLSVVKLQSLINDKLAEKYVKDKSVYLRLTEEGELLLKKHYIDYQIDLLKLEYRLGNFFYDLVNRLQREKVGRVALYGASDTTLSIYRHLTNNNIRIISVLDDDKTKVGQKIYDSEVVAPYNLEGHQIDAIIISTIKYQDEIYEKAKNIYGGKYKIIKLFD